MKIAISASGNTLDSLLDPRFGRAPFFILVDAATDSVSVIDNSQSVNAAHGAGIQTAQKIIDNGAKVVITGNIGPKALSVLKSAGINMVTGMSGSCRECLNEYKFNT